MGYNIFEDRPQLVRVVIQYLNMKFGNLTPKTNPKRPESIFYIDPNRVMMEYDEKNGVVYINYGQIWFKIESLFSLDHRETQSIMKVWLERDYNLRNLKQMKLASDKATNWREITI
jgi:hypothetical protein